MAEQEFSDGQIGQIRDSVLYDRALTEAEIAALCETTLPVESQPTCR